MSSLKRSATPHRNRQYACLTRRATHSARRLAILFGPGFFFLLSVIVLAASPEAGTRVFYVFMTIITGYWLVRCWRAELQITDAGVVLRGQARTRRYAWGDIEEAVVVRMRSASPFAASFPYVTVGLRLKSGRLQRFSDLSAPQRHPERVQGAVQDINRLRP